MPLPTSPPELFVTAAGFLTTVSRLFLQAYSSLFRGSPGKAILMWGDGSPETVIPAPVGSVFLRTNGGASTTLYVKESGTGTTGWRAV